MSIRGLYGIADSGFPTELADQARMLERAGACCVQLRCKGWSRERVQALVQRLQLGVPLIVNDFGGLGDGVHRGQEDGPMPWPGLRGRSTHSLEQIDAAVAEGGRLRRLRTDLRHHDQGDSPVAQGARSPRAGRGAQPGARGGHRRPDAGDPGRADGHRSQRLGAHLGHPWGSGPPVRGALLQPLRAALRARAFTSLSSSSREGSLSATMPQPTCTQAREPSTEAVRMATLSWAPPPSAR